MSSKKEKSKSARKELIKGDQKYNALAGRQYLNKNAAAAEIDAFGTRGTAGQEKYGNLNYGHQSNIRGRFLKPSSKDDRLAIAARLGPITPFGVQIADDSIIDIVQEKQQQEVRAAELALASYAADPDDPASLERVYNMWPELRSIPEEQHTDDLLIQETIRTMLRDGGLGGPEDNKVMFHLLKPDTEIPIFPLWDPTGIYISKLMEDLKPSDISKIFNPDNNDANVNLGLWGQYFIQKDPRIIDQRSQQYWDFQKKLKILILRRCYHGFKKTPDTIVDTFVDRLSTMNGQVLGSTSESVVSKGTTPEKSFWDKNWSFLNL